MDTNIREKNDDASTSQPLAAIDAKGKDKLPSEIVRILSNTLNDAIQELGYFPGIGHALVEVRAEAVKLREQNAKLMDDNTTLSRITNQQREQIKKLTEQPVAEEALVRGLQHQVQQLKIDRDSLLRTQQQYTQENQYLHMELDRLTGGGWHQNLNLTPPSRLMNSRPPQAQTSAVTSSATHPLPQPQAISHDSQQRSNKTSITLIPPTPSAGPSRQTSPTGVHAGHSLNAWQHYHVKSSQPRASTSQAVPHPTAQYSPASPTHSQYQYHWTSPTHAQLSATSPTQAQFPANYPTRAQYPATSPTRTQFPHVTFSRPPSAPRPPSASRPPSAPIHTASPHCIPESQHVSVTTIDLTKDDTNGAAAEEQRAPKRRRTEDEPAVTGSSRSNMDMQSVNTEINTLQREIDPSPPVRPDSGPSMLPLLGMPSGSATEASRETTEVTMANTEPRTEEVQEAADEEDEEDEDEEMIDIWDEHGMVKVELCLEAAYEEVDGKFMCKMCEFRSRNTDGKAPEPLADSSEAALVRHCEEEHPVGWATLRKGNRKEENAEDTAVSKDDEAV